MAAAGATDLLGARPRSQRRRPAAPRAAVGLGALVALYLGYPLAAFVVRLATSPRRGFGVPGLWSALATSVLGATISLVLCTVTGVPLAYLLARHRGRLSAAINLLVQLPLALPPLMGGIVLVYLVGPYTFLGQLSGERLTQTLAGVVIAQTFVSAPFLVVTARAAFREVDPALEEVAATLGYGRLRRLLQVAVPAAAGGIRAGMVLTWLRAFGEYGSTVVLAYHPYTLPVYTEVQFSSAPLSTTEAPTALGLLAAGVAIAVSQLRSPRRRRPLPAAAPPVAVDHPPVVVAFDLRAQVGRFSLTVAHQASAHRLAIVGPSGSGKSLTLRSLAGVLPSAHGSVRFGDDDVGGLHPEERRVGYVPQGYGLVPGRPVWAQLASGPNSDPQRAAWWLERLGLRGLEDRLPEQLSGGQRQRVGLARALATDPAVVLLDEPLSALDTPVRAELRREFRRLQRELGLSTVLVTHDPQEAAALADEIVVVGDGAVLQAGAIAEVFERPVSPAVARLLGIDNVLTAEVLAGGALRTAAGDLPVATGLPAGRAALCRVDPQRLRLLPAGLDPGASVGGPVDARPATLVVGTGTVVDTVGLVRRWELTVAIGAAELAVHLAGPPPAGIELGAAVVAVAPADGITAWAAPAGTEPAPRAATTSV